MKNLLIDIKISFVLLALLIFSLPAVAKDLARVSKVKGSAFVSQGLGAAKTLKKGDLLPQGVNVIVEDNSQLMLRDFHDQTFHLAGGSQLYLQADFWELKSGKLWVQSQAKNRQTVLRTANAKVLHSRGEFLLTFSSSKGRSQVMVVSGEVELANLLEEQLQVSIDSGKFSFVDQEYQKGMPRTPTNIGFESFNKVTTFFDGVAPMEKGGILSHLDEVEEGISVESMNRQIIAKSNEDIPIAYPSLALNENDKAHAGQKGEIIFLKSGDRKNVGRLPSSIEGAEREKKVSSTKKGKPIKFMRVSDVLLQEAPIELRVFGREVTSLGNHEHRSPANLETVSDQEPAQEQQLDPNNASSEDSKEMVLQLDGSEVPVERSPASVIKAIEGHVIPEDAFKKSYREHSDAQKPHSSEVRGLIEELESYDKDFELSY